MDVDLPGAARVLAEASVCAAPAVLVRIEGRELKLDLSGPPNSRSAVETATDLHGPWVSLEEVVLGANGSATVTVQLDSNERVRFYRTIEQ
jgi:hypothetical protein